MYLQHLGSSLARYQFRSCLCQAKSFYSLIPSSKPCGKQLHFWKWTKRCSLSFVGTFAVLTLSGVLYQSTCEKRDAKRYPPIGRRVNIGGYHIHLYTTGTKGPSVILDAGMGGNVLSWSLIQPEIAKFAQVTALDRPGNGWSDESPSERTSQNIVTELRTALRIANIPAPYIFVGHSFGGVHAQLWAALHPNEIFGIILVDSIHGKQPQIIPIPKINDKMLLLACRLGLIRLFTDLPTYKKSVAVFSKEVQDKFLAQLLTKKFTKTVLLEYANLETSCKQLIDAGSLGNKPLIVITAGKATSAEGSRYTQEQVDAMHILFKELQKDLVAKSTKGKQIIAEKSDHMITLNQPEVIIDAVKDMVNLCREE